MRRAHGRPSLETVRELLPNSDYVAENEFVLQGEIEDTEGVVPLPGARELLNSLPADRWAIVTSCSRPLAEVRLKAAGLPIPRRLLTSDDVTKGKPDPEPYRKGAALLGVPASKCLVFEDAPAGVRGGESRWRTGGRFSDHLAGSRTGSGRRRLDCAAAAAGVDC